jgi:hypothetical protein
MANSTGRLVVSRKRLSKPVILSLPCDEAASQNVTLSERSEVEGEAKLVLAQSKDL